MRLPLFSLALLALASPVEAGEVHAAVAANFTKVAEELAAGFTASTGHGVVFSFGATGALYTQIVQGAPFEVFFSADDTRTRTAIDEGFAVPGTEFTYAIGTLALYGPGLDLGDGAGLLATGAFRHLAVADPAKAPYGAVAAAAMDALGLADKLAGKIVTGDNITQTLMFVESGSTELGFVAMSQVVDKPQTEVWIVPQADYPPIRQNAVLLKAGENDEAARAFLDYVRSPDAARIIEAAGYALD